MSEPTERCPTCRTVLPDPGAAQCPACGRVLGEANRCPHCQAVAGVLRRGQTTVCAACGKARAGAVVVGRVGPARDPATRAMLARASGRTRRVLGILLFAAALLLSSGAAALAPGTVGLVLALLVGLVGVGLGGLAIASGGKRMAEADRLERSDRERKVLALARKRGGRLTAEDVAVGLAMDRDAADAALTGLVGDGSSVDVDVDEEGGVTYVFRDLLVRSARARVEAEPAPAAVEEVLPPEAIAEAQVERK